MSHRRYSSKDERHANADSRRGHAYGDSLFRFFVLGVLVYGMEVVTPKATLMKKQERTYKNVMKQILSLPVTVADLAVYVLSGAVPVEAVIHKKALMLFGSVCRLDDEPIACRTVVCLKF